MTRNFVLAVKVVAAVAELVTASKTATRLRILMLPENDDTALYIPSIVDARRRGYLEAISSIMASTIILLKMP
jgi:hypothetical protein